MPPVQRFNAPKFPIIFFEVPVFVPELFPFYISKGRFKLFKIIPAFRFL